MVDDETPADDGETAETDDTVDATTQAPADDEDEDDADNNDDDDDDTADDDDDDDDDSGASNIAMSAGLIAFTVASLYVL